jgi:hypothetical protein
MIAALQGPLHFDWTVSFGTILSTVSFLILAIIAWRDMNWRVGNLEQWRKEHMIDSDARDRLLTNIDKILYYVTRGKEDRR